MTWLGMTDSPIIAAAFVTAWNLAAEGDPGMDLEELANRVTALETLTTDQGGRLATAETALVTQANNLSGISADLSTAEDNLNAINNRLITLEGKVPLFITREQQTFEIMIPAWTAGNVSVDRINSPNRMTLTTFSQNTRVLSVQMSQEYGGIAANDSQYWKFELAKLSKATGLATTFAQKTTQTTGEFANGPLVARTPWSWDSANWLAADFQAGDSLQLIASPIGYTTVPPLRLPITISGRAGAL